MADRTGKRRLRGLISDQRLVGKDSLSGFGPITLMKRPVRIRMQGVVGAEGTPATRLCDTCNL